MIETDLFKSIIVLATGSLLGSFLNVVIYRLPREKSIVYPGSKCPSCNNVIAWYDNLPVLSWLLLGGKCRYCKNPIHFRYPAVELLTGILFLLTYAVFGIGWQWMFLAYFVCLLVVITWIDIDFMLIFNSLTYPGIAVGFIYSYINNNLQQSVLGSIIGTVLFYLIAKISLLVMKKEGMGMGDVTLVALIGAWLGLNDLIGSLMISFFLGSVIGIMLLLKKGKSEHFPFGPSLTLAALITLLTKNYLVTWYISKFL
ncbi:MAG: prepilin peptidase [Candidatus Sericytochromatia bacterium]|nr:prepilin peptidase [Candidatus Sericytochromatia bacterium]